MKKFNNYEEAKASAEASGVGQLPAGAYVCKVMNVRYVEGENGNSDRIDLMFDIEEGDQKGFFKKQYDANTAEDKKWKGKTSLYVPKDDGSEQDGWTKRSFAGWTSAFEKSNSGYTWDWDENKWKNKLVGIVFGETGNVINGKEVKYTEARFATPVSKVRDGSAPEAKFKTRNGYTGAQNSVQNTSASSNGFMDIPDGVGDEMEIPF